MAENNSQWIGHICGAKNVVKAVQNEPYAPGSDGAAILGWVYYYDVLATFSLRHWRTSMVKRTAAVLGFDPKQSRSCAVQYIIARDSFARKIPHISKYAHEVVGLLSEVFNTIMYTWSPQYSDEDYRQYLDGLETRLQRHLPLAGAEIGTLPQAVTKGTASEIELFRLAALVYLERASKNFSGQSKKLQCWTDEACSILAELGSCRHPFPLFIFGCEGRTDERRLAILHLIAATEQDPHVRNLREVKALIQSVWTQDDLAVDGQVEYIRKLNLVISSKDDIPSFV